jgi:two-component system CheB/CheR fusion protein
VIPTPALTAGATDRERDRALDAGFDLHLAKPIRPDRLAEVVLSLANRQAL